MASALYATGVNAFLTGGINWTSDTIKVALVSAAYTANMSTDQYFSTVSGIAGAVVGTPMTLTNATATGGVANADSVTSAAISSGSTITQIVIFKSTGTDSTSQLIAREDVASTPTNGGTVTITWDSGVNKIFSL